MSEFSPNCTGDERVMFLAHDIRMTLEAELWQDLEQRYEAGLMTEREVEDAYIEWVSTHREIERPPQALERQ